MSLSLTGKQRKFAEAVAQGMSLTDAYRHAYNAQNMKPAVIGVKACELMANGKVAVMVSNLREDARKRHDVTVDSITAMLKEDRDMAKELGQASAAISASMGLAKLHGLITDKVSTKLTTKNSMDDMTDAELAAIAAGRSSDSAQETDSTQESDRVH